MPATPLSLSSVSAAHVARAAGQPRALWRQVCVQVRIELKPSVATALREILSPQPGAAVSGDHEAALRVLQAAGIDPRELWRTTGGLPVHLAESLQGPQFVGLVVDAVASDLPYVATWKPAAAPTPPAASQVLARSGYGVSRAEPVAPLLEACTRFAERLTAACETAAAYPFEFRILAWPMARAGARDAAVVERYIAGGPNAADYARLMAQQRQAEIVAARAARPPATAFSRQPLVRPQSQATSGRAALQVVVNGQAAAGQAELGAAADEGEQREAAGQRQAA